MTEVPIAKLKRLDWTWNEIVLAGALLAENNWVHPREGDPRVLELSNTLRGTAFHPLEGRSEKFRSTGSISRKITDIQTQAANYTGTKTRGNRLDHEVAKQFIADPDRMINEAWFIRQAILADAIVLPQPSPLLESPLNAGPADEEPVDIDTRKRVLAEQVIRIGQAGFRLRLMTAYNGRCAVSGSGVIEVLQAAHIRRYLGSHSNTTANGLLLRSDLHLLFDANLLTFDNKLQTRLHPRIKISPEYREIEGIKLRRPPAASNQPDNEALEQHFQTATADW